MRDPQLKARFTRGVTEWSKVDSMARKLIEAETPHDALKLMQPIRIYIAVSDGFFSGSHGYPHLPVFSNDPAELHRIYPHATVIEYIARPTQIMSRPDQDPGMGTKRE